MSGASSPWQRNPWTKLPTGAILRTGHCRRCDNGLGHHNGRRGWRRPTGLLLQRDRLTYDDELAPGEKVKRRRAIRHAESAAVRHGTGSDAG